MIAVDTSALIAALLEQERGEDCAAALRTSDHLVISAGTLSEAFIVATARNIRPQMQQLIDELDFDVVPVTSDTAKRVADAYARWGRGHHRAALNFGDCFAYEVAKAHGCPLLYVGKDFAKTDVASVL